MDKETLSNYGWIVIAVLVLAVMVALATPFGQFIENGIKSTAQGLFDVNQGALGGAGIIDNTKYIELSSEDDIYALARVLSPNKTKDSFFGLTYDINEDLEKFEYPNDITDTTAKIDYLSAASYKLTNDVTLTMQRKNDKTHFIGIGSYDFPFNGTFNGNGHTITLQSGEKIAVNDNMNFDIGLFGNAQNAKLSNITINVTNDILVERTTKELNIGILMGCGKNCNITNCTVNVINSKIGVDYANGETYVNVAHIGGLIGDCDVSTIYNCTTTLTDSAIYANGYDVSAKNSMYAYFSVGGLIGFSHAGSDNTNDIGKIGNQVLSCKVISNNATQQDVIFASIETGDEMTAGGLVGCSFNNFIAKDCSVEITNGNIVATKTGEIDNAQYGTQVGGIIGRLEHTGEIYNCSVNGNNLNIISKSNNTGNVGTTNAGGIAGYAHGAYHRNVAALNKCSFNGNNTSTISAKTTLASGRAHVGGLAGFAGYKIIDCSVENVTIENSSENSAKSFAGKLFGWWSHSELAMSGQYFVPDTAEIINCAAQNVNIDVSDNVGAGEIYGRT